MIHLVTLLSLAQTAADAQPDAADTFAVVYLAIGGVVMTGLGWLAAWGIGKLKGTKAKEIAGRFIAVFNVGLQGAHAKFKLELEAARDPNSPGGAVITDKEWQGIRDHMWDYLKATYGSFNALGKVVGALIGNNDAEAVKKFVDAKIDAGIAEMERADKAVSGSGPGPV